MRYTPTMWLAAAMLSLAMLVPSTAEATHFRFGSITHRPTGVPGQVEFTVKIAYRGTYPNLTPAQIPLVGATAPSDVIIDFGDGSPQLSNPPMTVVARSVAEDWIILERVFIKQYANPLTYTFSITRCCRISSLYYGGDQTFLLRSRVQPYSLNASPVTSSVPVVFMEPSAASTYTIPASDPNNNRIRFRLADPPEYGNFQRVPNIAINPTTGQITWNNTGMPTTNFYTLQVIIEDYDANDNLLSTTPIDFLMRIQAPIGNPPNVAVTPLNTYKVNPGSPLTFTVTGTDVDANAVVTLSNSGLPGGASMTPVMPVSGASGIASVFSWTPTLAQTGNYSITYMATDEFSNQALTSVQINVNRPPTAYAGDPQVLECSGTGQTATLDGSGSSDPDNDPLTYTWYDNSNVQVATGPTPTVPVALGLNTFTLVVSDGAATDDSQVTVTVVDTEAPVADAATLPDVTGQCSATVTTIPTATDGCSGTINGTTTDPLYYDQQGTYTITWTYNDGNGHTTTQTQTVIIEDDTDPVLTVNAGTQLWSPNHTYHRFTLSQMIASVSDNCGAVSSYISSVTSDEEEDAIGDGNTLDDMVIVDCQTVDLRAERAGVRNGRVYTVYITAEDAVGNTTTVPYKVTVPKSTSSGPAVEDAVLYTVTSACPTSPKGGVRTAATAVTLDLGQNYPNPFNPSTTIRYALPVDGHASLRVFDMTGAEVAVLFSGVQAAGAYAVEFDASALPSGVYMYRLEQAGTTATKLMQLMK